MNIISIKVSESDVPYPINIYGSGEGSGWLDVFTYSSAAGTIPNVLQKNIANVSKISNSN